MSNSSQVEYPDVGKIGKHLQWRHGGMAISLEDGRYLSKIIAQHNVKTIVDFGLGVSTQLFILLGLETTTYEADDHWIKRFQTSNRKHPFPIKLWDGKTLATGTDKRFDMAFVDGPMFGRNRRDAVRLAADFADLVVVHDAYRAEEREWQNMFLTPNFELIGKGGHDAGAGTDNYCWVWCRTG